MIYCNSDNGMLYYMGTRLVGDVSWPPVTYTMSLGGDSSYGIGATSKYRGVTQTSTPVDTSYRQIPVYQSSVVSVKLTNKEGYRYNLHTDGLSATGTSRDTYYTYLTGIVTGDVSVYPTGYTYNTFTATSTYLTRYIDYFANNLYGGFIFYKSACTNPDAILDESSQQSIYTHIRTAADMSQWYTIEKSGYASTFAPVLRGELEYTARCGYIKYTTSRGTAGQIIGVNAVQGEGTDYVATLWSAGQDTLVHPGTVSVRSTSEYSSAFSYFSYDTYLPRNESSEVSWYKDRVWVDAIFTGVLK